LRQVPFEALAPLFTIPGITWISIQKGSRANDCDGTPVHRIEDLDGTMLDAAAYIKALDLIISIDSGPIHIAGAMGVPVWMLLPVIPDPRWEPTGEKTAWYPSMRMFRQNQANDWTPVIGAIREELVGPGQMQMAA